MAMLECLLVAGNDGPLRQAFHELYRLHLDDKSNPDRLFDGLMTALSAVLENKTKDLPILLALSANTRAVVSHSALIEASLKAFLTAKRPASQADIEESLTRLARASQKLFSPLRIETNRGPRVLQSQRFSSPHASTLPMSRNAKLCSSPKRGARQKRTPPAGMEPSMSLWHRTIQTSARDAFAQSYWGSGGREKHSLPISMLRLCQADPARHPKPAIGWPPPYTSKASNSDHASEL